MRNNKIVTAMACATASMLAGLALGPSAMAADTTITLQGADGASLAGHTVNLPDLTVGASVPFAEMIASGMAT